MYVFLCLDICVCVCVGGGREGYHIDNELRSLIWNQKKWTRADNANSANSYKGSSQMIDWIIRVQCSRTHHNIWPKLFGTDHHCHRVWTRLNQADLRLISSGTQHKREMISKHGNDSQWKQEQRKYLEKRHQRKFMRPGSLCAVRLELRVKSLNLGEHVRLTHFQFKFYNSEVSNLIWNGTSA